MKRNFFAKVVAMAGTAVAQLLLASAAHASNINNATDLKNILCQVVFSWMFVFLLVLSAIMGLVGGYWYATSGGDSEKVKKATNTLIYAAVGVVVALMAKGIPTLVGNLLGQTGVAGC